MPLGFAVLLPDAIRTQRPLTHEQRQDGQHAEKLNAQHACAQQHLQADPGQVRPGQANTFSITLVLACLLAF